MHAKLTNLRPYKYGGREMEYSGMVLVSAMAALGIAYCFSQRGKSLIEHLSRTIRTTNWNSAWVECEPLVCFFCTYLGVISTIAWTSSMLPLADTTTILVSTLSPVGSIAVTARVYDVRSHNRWEQQSDQPLIVRMLRAYSDGVMWLRWLRKREE
jgi:hypothetical protein